MLTDTDLTNPYVLSYLADCAGPDNKQSPGSAFLLEVAADAQEADPEQDPADEARRIADEAVYRQESRGTYSMILAAVDICAYQEDIEDVQAPTTDAVDLLRAGLYMIAERLASTILQKQSADDY